MLGDGAQAAGDYPNKPVRIFLPYGPGGAGDLTIRLLGDKLSQSLKQPFVIENRPGAGGIAAVRAVLEAPADGYTLGVMGNGQAITASLFRDLPYNVLNDFRANLRCRELRDAVGSSSHFALRVCARPH